MFLFFLFLFLSALHIIAVGVFFVCFSILFLAHINLEKFSEQKPHATEYL